MRVFQEEDLIFRRILHNKGARDPSWEGLYKIVGVLTLDAYKLVHLNGDRIPRLCYADYLRMHYQ